ncbi:MAG: thioredoxin-disulfide reductase, partial [Dehalococcoidia bacterium]|nr:thioredoxin-disulfide reductase [Dehalococcoidia bacterium]
MTEVYDVAIIGGGPGGLTAGLYAARGKLKSVLLERGLAGGQIVNAERVENYPGFPEGISGMELGERMLAQASKYGLDIAYAEATGVELKGKIKTVHTSRQSYTTKSIIIAAGSEHRKLGVPGEKDLLGRGVSYCATCDAPFFREQRVAVVGGGDVALTDALFLSRFASRVIIIHRRRELRATGILQERASAERNIEFLWDTMVEAVEGNGQVQKLLLRRVDTKEKSTLAVDGVFVAIGLEPNTHFLEGKIPLSPANQVIVNGLMETEIPGVLAVGDIRQNSPRQAVTAAGDGANAAISVVR